MLPYWLTVLSLLSIPASTQPHAKRAGSRCRPSVRPSSTPSVGINPIGTTDYRPGTTNPLGGTTTTTGNTTSTGAGSSSGSGGITFPQGCLVSSSGYGVGVNFDTDPSTLVSGLGANPCVYGRFYELSDWTDLANQAGSMVQLANSVNSILMLSLKTSKTFDYGDDAIASVVKALNGLNAKQPIWLRFGHEMTMLGPEQNYPNNPAAYVALWKKVAGGVDRTKIKMYWCMNPPAGGGQSWENLASWAQPWYPGDEFVDLNGIDTYATDASSQLKQVGMPPSFCQLFGSKPIFNGEVGVFGNADRSVKEGWIKQLIDPAIKSWCPSYIGFAWFEIQKDGIDYTAAGNGILKSVVGGGGGAGGGGAGGTVATY